MIRAIKIPSSNKQQAHAKEPKSMSSEYFPVPHEGAFSIDDLQGISDWLYSKSFTLEEVHALVPRLYAQLSNCTDEELQHHLLYALGEAHRLSLKLENSVIAILSPR